MNATTRRVVLALAVVAVVTVSIVTIQNALIDRYFVSLPRFVTDFSVTYFERNMHELQRQPPHVVFIGDSVLWGFALDPADTAVASLARNGCRCTNFAFKSGSPPNFYVMARAIEAAQLHPQAIVLEVNEKVFNESDPSYDHLHPAIEALAGPYLNPTERATLHVEPTRAGPKSTLDSALTRTMLLYAMRSDIRETLYGDVPDPIAKPTTDQLEGVYDLSPLSNENVGIQFLEKTFAVFQRAKIPVVAFLTPTNHALLHEYIDNPSYRSNLHFLSELARAHGAKILDLDSVFEPRYFIDGDHLTAAGQTRLASTLAREIPVDR